MGVTIQNKLHKKTVETESILNLLQKVNLSDIKSQHSVGA